MFKSGQCKSTLFVIFGALLATSAPTADGYKHVVFMHGIFSGPSSFDLFGNLVQQYHPGTPLTLVNLFNDLKSLTDLQIQLKSISDLLQPVLTNKSSEGTILICYSQGGMLCRGLLASIEHNVDTFISLSSPLAGQFGDSDYLKFLFPKYIKKNIYKLFYTQAGQKLSFANYWNDPHQQPLFEKFSNFLAVFNNQSAQANPKSYEFRNNFLRLKNLVLAGGPDDGVITPWQSSQFGMYNSSEAVLPMEEQKWFQNDAFGLKTLSSTGRIHKVTIPGIKHVAWHSSKQVFETCIKQWLT